MKNNIMSLLEEKGMSQTELAKQVGVSRWYMNKIINGKVHLGKALASRIAYELDCSIQDIFSKTN